VLRFVAFGVRRDREGPNRDARTCGRGESADERSRPDDESVGSASATPTPGMGDPSLPLTCRGGGKC